MRKYFMSLFNNCKSMIAKFNCKTQSEKNKISSSPEEALKTQAEIINYLKLNHKDYFPGIEKTSKMLNSAMEIIKSNDNQEEKLSKFFDEYLSSTANESEEERLRKLYIECMRSANINHLPN